MINNINKYISKILYWDPSRSMFVISIIWSKNTTNVAKKLHQNIYKNMWNCSLYASDSVFFDNMQTKASKYNHYNIQNFLAQSKLAWSKIAIFSFDKKNIIDWLDSWVRPDMVLFHWIQDDDVNLSDLFFRSIKYVFENEKNNKIVSILKDDKFGSKRYNELSWTKSINYGIKTSALLQAQDLVFDQNKINFVINYLWKKHNIEIDGSDEDDVYCHIASISACLVLWIDILDCLI